MALPDMLAWLLAVPVAAGLLLVWLLWRNPHWLRRLALDLGQRQTVRRWLGQLVGKLLLPPLHQRLLLGLLDLDRCTVNDIMIPRQAVAGIDLDADIADILQALRTTQHTRLPIFHGDLNHTVGILHVRNAARSLGQGDLSKADITRYMRSPYFLPERTPLPAQLLAFQKHRRRLGLVVDEYGDVLGIVTLEAILEELVGEFTTRGADSHPDITAGGDGNVLVDGAASLRAINRTLGWTLPVDGPRTLNGLLLEQLEEIPEGPLCLMVGRYRIEVTTLRGNLVGQASIRELAAS